MSGLLASSYSLSDGDGGGQQQTLPVTLKTVTFLKTGGGEMSKGGNGQWQTDLESGLSLPQPTFCAAAEPDSTAAPWVHPHIHTFTSKEIHATKR